MLIKSKSSWSLLYNSFLNKRIITTCRYLAHRTRHNKVLTKVLKDIDENKVISTNKIILNDAPIDKDILKYIVQHEIGRIRRTGKRGKHRDEVMRDPRRKMSHLQSLFATKLVRMSLASRPSQFPTTDLPEIAFAGRSNVGKSSLLKALSIKFVRAQVDDRPGTTRSLGFYALPKHLSIVDLPGYGFAYAPEVEQKKWAKVMSTYFKERKTLKRVMIMIDARLGLKQSDRELMQLLESFRVPYQCVMTKCDLVKPTNLAKRVWVCQEELKAHKHCIQRVQMVSSISKIGVPELMSELTGLMNNNNTLTVPTNDKIDAPSLKLVPAHLGVTQHGFKRLKEDERQRNKEEQDHLIVVKKEIVPQTEPLKPQESYPINFMSSSSSTTETYVQVARERTKKNKIKKKIPKAVKPPTTSKLSEKYRHL